MEYLRKTDRPKGAERGLDLAGKALTPRSERPRKSWGSLVVSLQTTGGLCGAKKCCRKENHAGAHWPTVPTE